jgi:hypothetical protein
MKDDLQRSSDEIDQAIRALQRARESCRLDERLRCIHIARRHAHDAHDLIVGWRTGQEPKPEEKEEE